MGLTGSYATRTQARDKFCYVCKKEMLSISKSKYCSDECKRKFRRAKDKILRKTRKRRLQAYKHQTRVQEIKKDDYKLLFTFEQCVIRCGIVEKELIKRGLLK